MVCFDVALSVACGPYCGIVRYVSVCVFTGGRGLTRQGGTLELITPMGVYSSRVPPGWSAIVGGLLLY